jgi:hypothetical protein
LTLSNEAFSTSTLAPSENKTHNPAFLRPKMWASYKKPVRMTTMIVIMTTQ